MSRPRSRSPSTQTVASSAPEQIFIHYTPRGFQKITLLVDTTVQAQLGFRHAMNQLQIRQHFA